MKKIPYVRVHYDTIRNCESFKKLPLLQRKLILNKTTLEKIENGVNVCKNRGWDLWKSQTSHSNNINEIIKELHEQAGVHKETSGGGDRVC